MPKNQPFIDLNAMSPDELSAYNRKIRRQASQRARRIRKGLKHGKTTYGYKEAVRKGLVKPKTKAERKIAPKKKKPFPKLSRKEQIKEVRDTLEWLNSELSSVGSYRKLWKEIKKGYGESSAGEGGGDYSSFVYRLYDRFVDLYPALNYITSRRPRHRYNSESWLEAIADILDTSSSSEEIFDRIDQLGREAYEEEQQRNSDDDDSFFNGGGRQR